MIVSMAGAPTHGLRDFRGSAKSPGGAFTRGSRGSWGKTAGGILPRATVALDESIPVVAARRPWRELPDARVKVISRAAVCPGCGIVPPRARKCDNCWE